MLFFLNKGINMYIYIYTYTVYIDMQQILNKAANWQLTTAVSRQLSALLFSPLLNLTCWAGLIASTASHIPRWGMKWKFSESHHPNFPTPFVSYHLIKHHLEQQLKLQCWFCCIPRLPNWSLKTWTNPNTLAFFSIEYGRYCTHYFLRETNP